MFPLFSFPPLTREAGPDVHHAGINTTYGVYSAYYIQNNHFAGGTTFRYAWVGGLSVAFALACAPLANWLLRRFEFRVVMMLGKPGPVRDEYGKEEVRGGCS